MRHALVVCGIAAVVALGAAGVALAVMPERLPWTQKHRVMQEVQDEVRRIKEQYGPDAEVFVSCCDTGSFGCKVILVNKGNSGR